jgi:hypothetical protein
MEPPPPREAAEPLSDVLRRVARRGGKEGGDAALHQRAAIRLHRLVRWGGARSRELALAVTQPTREGVSTAVLEAFGIGTVLLAVEYEVDDGGSGRQQHGDLLFWEPALGRLVAVECKRIAGGEWVERHAAKRAAEAGEQARRIASRLQSWLAHLCRHDDSLARCEALCDGAQRVAAATLTENGVMFFKS